MKNLRVAVVPTETTGNGIDQSSTVEEILACKETVLYPITDYFKAQNDGELPIHRSFLIDIEKKINLTGTNIDGIHMNTKASQISEIKKIIREWGSTSTSELELESSPCISSIGNDKQNVSQLVEMFYADHVEAITYQHDVEIGWDDIDYEDLSNEIINEIWHIMMDYDTEQQKTMDRCKSENY